MKIDLHKIKIRDLVKNYMNNAEEGVFGYDAKLNIRPPYQREFRYDIKQQQAVINTINKGYPLNVMYWALNKNGTLEVLDGQQRTMSICEYVACNYSLNKKQFNNLTETEQNRILDYELYIYICKGNDEDKLDWFRTINIAGLTLSRQELRNAVYTGSWLVDAKEYFSKTKCGGYNVGKKYIKKQVKDQSYLEVVLKWASNNDIEGYMSKHQHEPSASELWLYFKNVINWVEVMFTVYRPKAMYKVDWGFLYNEFRAQNLNPKELEEDIKILMLDSDVDKKEGIYNYVLSGDESKLKIRAFDDNQKQEAYERQNGKCAITGKETPIDKMHADHIEPWALGGKTIADNCQMVSIKGHYDKTKTDIKLIKLNKIGDDDFFESQQKFITFINDKLGDKLFKELRDIHDYLYPVGGQARRDNPLLKKQEIVFLLEIRNKWFAHGNHDIDIRKAQLNIGITLMNKIINRH